MPYPPIIKILSIILQPSFVRILPQTFHSSFCCKLCFTPPDHFFQRTRFQFSTSACLHSRQTTLGLPRFWKCSTVQSSSLSLPLWFSIPSDSCPVRQLLLSTLAITSLPTFQFLIHNTSELSSSYIHIHLSTL